MLKWSNMQTKKRKKVCFAITKGNWGGAQKYVYSLATSLSKDKYETFVITGFGDILKDKLEAQNIKVYVIENLKRDISVVAEIKSFFKLLKIILREKPDILHLNSPKVAGFGGVAGRLCRTKKIIQTVHGFTFNEERDFATTAMITFFSWLTILFCHKTITINEKEKNQALKMPLVSENKIILIRNGIEKTDFKEKSSAQRELIRKCLTWTSDVQVGVHPMSDIGQVIWIGTISELHKNKGLEYVIEAVSKIKSLFVFFILGEGEERKNLENLIEKYNLKDKVFLIGFLENANQYLKAFDIFILPSIKEGLPYTLLEAGSAGLASISTNVGGIPDIIENGISGIIVTKARSGEITRALEYLVSNPDKQKSYGENLKTKVEKDFSFDQMLEKTIELYEN